MIDERTTTVAWNEDKEPEVTPPGPNDVERITYDAVCTCCDTYGDDPWCPACYPAGRAALSTPPDTEETTA